MKPHPIFLVTLFFAAILFSVPCKSQTVQSNGFDVTEYTAIGADTATYAFQVFSPYANYLNVQTYVTELDSPYAFVFYQDSFFSPQSSQGFKISFNISCDTSTRYIFSGFIGDTMGHFYDYIDTFTTYSGIMGWQYIYQHTSGDSLLFALFLPDYSTAFPIDIHYQWTRMLTGETISQGDTLENSAPNYENSLYYFPIGTTTETYSLEVSAKNRYTSNPVDTTIYFTVTPLNATRISDLSKPQPEIILGNGTLRFMNADDYTGAQVCLCNISGQRVFDWKIRNDSETYDISSLPSGGYIVIIAGDTFISQKIIITH